MKKILIIGGTGIIGKQTIEESLHNNYQVCTVALQKDQSIPDIVQQVICNKNNEVEFEKAVRTLLVTNWDIVFDVYNLGVEDAKRTYKYFKDCAKHIFIVSTTLVYDRTTPTIGPIKTSNPLAAPGLMGGYVDHKLDLEEYWQSITQIPWTILRPYHVVGAGCLLGCIPDENRDPWLLERIKRGEPLTLCDGGNIQFNYVHPLDIAKIVLKAAGNPKTFGKAYNAVNPEPVTAKEYYEQIGGLLKAKIVIKSKSLKDIWSESKGWELTTLPHLYDTSDLLADVGYIPNIPLNDALKEAIDNYPKERNEKTEIAIHRRMTMLPRPKPIPWLWG